MSTKTKKEMDKENEIMTESILSGKARLIDLTVLKTKDYIKCKGAYSEVIEGRKRIAFVRCKKCRRYISVYKDEFFSYNTRTIPKKCACGFSGIYELEGWSKK